MWPGLNEFTRISTKSKLSQPRSILPANHISPTNIAGYSNSTVPGGLLVMSTTTLVTPCDLWSVLQVPKTEDEKILSLGVI